MTTTTPLTARILLLEDNPGDVELFRAHLGELSDFVFDLVVCERLDEGLSTLDESAPFDVAVLDVNLPDADGIQGIERLHDANDVPILVLTGGTHIDEDAFIRAGAQDYLHKHEFSAQALRRSIGFAMARRQRQQLLQLEHALQNYRRMSSDGTTTSVTRQLAGTSAIRERASEEFRELCRIYVGLFDTYLNQLLVEAPKPLREMKRIVRRLGELGGGPRDLLDIHLNALQYIVQKQTNDTRAQTYTVEGRLLALEMMGLLVDYYRTNRTPPVVVSGAKSTS